ncbi:hypothetical protein CYMTET_32341 [Cymbomonas tetramitiformis]|uniref:Uncharacterized protein n=1 Tax=Cymbomonas tetramitiformis TaxID=36881 RepID=A0AAE0FFY5_9CHLO|nr:hypothetical protein CYMTET_32341 [Cymbomonas tetramitiformis]
MIARPRTSALVPAGRSDFLRRSDLGRAVHISSTKTLAVADAEASSSNQDFEDEDDSRQLAIALAIEADQVKGKDILVLNVMPQIYWSRYFVLVSVLSRPQKDAVMARMKDLALEKFNRPWEKSPMSQSGAWAVMDLGDVVVHVFTPDEREYYDLETVYQECEQVELPFEGERFLGADEW